METFKAVALVFGGAFLALSARPVAALVVGFISRLWLNPNSASKAEYAVYFNRSYLRPRPPAGASQHNTK